jgi:hypothetical protein
MAVGFAGSPGEGIQWEGEEPTACATCGQVPERVIRLIEEVVDADQVQGESSCA